MKLLRQIILNSARASPLKRHHNKLLFAAFALTPVALLAQSLAPTPLYSEQAELSKVEEWVLSQGTEQSIAPELAAILGLGSDRLPVKVKLYVVANGVNQAFAVSTNPKQEGIVISALKTIAEQDGNLFRRHCLAYGQIRNSSPNDSGRCFWRQSSSKQLSRAEFKNIKAFFVKKVQATSPSNTPSPSPRISATAREGKGNQVIRVQQAMKHLRPADGS